MRFTESEFAVPLHTASLPAVFTTLARLSPSGYAVLSSISYFVEAVQLVSFALETEMPWGPNWFMHYVQGMVVLSRTLAKDTTILVYSILMLCAVLYIIVVWVLFLMLLINTGRGKTKEASGVSLLIWLTISGRFLKVYFLSTFLAVWTCSSSAEAICKSESHPMFVVLSVLGIASLLPIASALVLWRDTNPISRNPFATVPTERMEMVLLIAKIIMCILCEVFTRHKVARGTIGFLLALMLLCLHVYWLPFYSFGANYARGAEFGMFLATSLLALIISFRGESDAMAGLFFVALLVGGCTGALLVYVRLYFLDPSQHSHNVDVEIATRRYLADRALMEKLWACSGAVELSPEEKKKLDKVKDIYKEGLAYYKTSRVVRVSYVAFLLHYMRDSVGAGKIIAELYETPGTLLDVSFALFCLTEEWRRVEEAAHAADKVTLMRDLRCAVHAMQKAKLAIAQFWVTLRGETVNPELPSVVSKIIAYEKEATRTFTRLQEKFPTSMDVQLQYSRFLEEVKNDIGEAYKHYERAKELQERGGDSFSAISFSHVTMASGLESARERSALDSERAREKSALDSARERPVLGGQIPVDEVLISAHPTSDSEDSDVDPFVPLWSELDEEQRQRRLFYRRKLQSTRSSGVKRLQWLLRGVVLLLAAVLLVLFVVIKTTNNGVTSAVYNILLAGQSGTATQDIWGHALELELSQTGSVVALDTIEHAQQEVVRKADLVGLWTSQLYLEGDRTTTKHLWIAPNVPVLEFYGEESSAHMYNTWDANLLLVSTARQLGVDQYRTNYSEVNRTATRSAALLLSNGPGSFWDMYEALVEGYWGAARALPHRMLIALVVVIPTAVITFFASGVWLRPIFHVIDKERQATVDIFNAIPEHVVDVLIARFGANGHCEDSDTTELVTKKTRSLAKRFQYGYTAALCTIVLVFALSTVLCYLYLESLKAAVNGVRNSAERRSLLARILHSATFLAAGAPPLIPADALTAEALVARLSTDIEAMTSLHFDLKFGGENVWGLNGEAMNELMHTRRCSGHPLDSHLCYSLDSLFATFVTKARNVAREKDAAALIQVHRQLRKLYGSLAPLLVEATEISISSLDDHARSGDTMFNITFVTCFVVVILIYALIFVPITAHLLEEDQRTLTMLLMIPMDVVEKVPILMNFLSTGERIDAQQQLEEVQSRTKSILEAVADAVVVTDEMGTIIEFNPGAEAMFGFNSYEARGENVSILMGEPHREQHPSYMSRYMETQESSIVGSSRETIAQRKDGTTFPVLLSLSKGSVRGKLFFASIIRDITEMIERETELQAEKDRAEKLLLNVLPRAIAERLKVEPSKSIADAHDDVTILFTDIVGFTSLSSKIDAQGVVEMLNNLFSMFDQLVLNLGLEKIKTIGDAYMCAGGLNGQQDHPVTVIDCGLRFLSAVEFYNKQCNSSLQIRVGIHTGAVVAGVIGSVKFAYDIWGDSVNIASRMESTGMAGEIQISAATAARVGDLYTLRPRGSVQVKGKGRMETFFVEKAGTLLENGADMELPMSDIMSDGGETQTLFGASQAWKDRSMLLGEGPPPHRHRRVMSVDFRNSTQKRKTMPIFSSHGPPTASQGDLRAMIPLETDGFSGDASYIPMKLLMPQTPKEPERNTTPPFPHEESSLTLLASPSPSTHSPRFIEERAVDLSSPEDEPRLLAGAEATSPGRTARSPQGRLSILRRSALMRASGLAEVTPPRWEGGGGGAAAGSGGSARPQSLPPLEHVTPLPLLPASRDPKPTSSEPAPGPPAFPSASPRSLRSLASPRAALYAQNLHARNSVSSESLRSPRSLESPCSSSVPGLAGITAASLVLMVSDAEESSTGT